MDKATFTAELNKRLAARAGKGSTAGQAEKIDAAVAAYEKTATTINWAALLAFIEQLIALFNPTPTPAG